MIGDYDIEECGYVPCPGPECGKLHIVARSETACIGHKLAIHCSECGSLFEARLEQADQQGCLSTRTRLLLTAETLRTRLQEIEEVRCPN